MTENQIAMTTITIAVPDECANDVRAAFHREADRWANRQ